ncbi:LytR/AlgR family response regulator transcription factor [Polaribacter sp. Hel1_85]|uniref:LytR/AlgR family response regulator transcription factor n=1 Tax=Polaribacter sp. Hel1_85 TaxID=1250005 RepID=UPI00052D7E9D|nr:response regulator [Polaribacter sp. Hel1_85]KGL63373.1 response regulator, LylTr family [Polaribacter sp. Hel1_85]
MYNGLKIFIVEDMAISRVALEQMLLRNDYEVIGSAAKAEKAWGILQETAVDLVLLDINLAGPKNGIWLAQQIRKYLNVPIVFLTAYGDQKTLKGVIETKPNGYLMKPYQEPTLITTISIAIQNFLDNQKETITSDSGTILNNVIYIKDKHIRVKLKIEDIFFIKSDGNYLELKLKEKTHVVRSKLSEFQKLLPPTVFHQIHQRYIINKEKVAVLGKDFVTINNVDIPVSQTYKKEIEALFSTL